MKQPIQKLTAYIIHILHLNYQSKQMTFLEIHAMHSYVSKNYNTNNFKQSLMTKPKTYKLFLYLTTNFIVCSFSSMFEFFKKNTYR